MIRLSSVTILTLMLLGNFMKQAIAQPITEPQAVTVTLANSYYVDWQAGDQNPQAQPYRVFVSVPSTPAPESGFPVVYLVDGNAFFNSAVSVVQQLVHPRAGGKQPAIIVGLGYPIDEPYDIKRRWFDLTPPTPEPPKAPQKHMDSYKDLHFGGADQTLALLVDQIRPWLASQYAINPKQQILFGHSLGGLFSLYVLHQNPDAFTGYGAASPSLWWNEGYLKPMLQQQEHGPRMAKPLLMVMGGKEADFMLTDAKQAQQWFTEQGIHSEYREIPYMNHGAVSLPALTMALEVLLPSQ